MALWTVALLLTALYSSSLAHRSDYKTQQYSVRVPPRQSITVDYYPIPITFHGNDLLSNSTDVVCKLSWHSTIECTGLPSDWDYDMHKNLGFLSQSHIHVRFYRIQQSVFIVLLPFVQLVLIFAMAKLVHACLQPHH